MLQQCTFHPRVQSLETAFFKKIKPECTLFSKYMDIYDFNYNFSSRNIKKTPVIVTVAMPGVMVALPHTLSFLISLNVFSFSSQLLKDPFIAQCFLAQPCFI